VKQQKFFYRLARRAYCLAAKRLILSKMLIILGANGAEDYAYGVA